MGKGQQNYGLFVDDVVKQRWDFTGSSQWKVETWAEPFAGTSWRARVSLKLASFTWISVGHPLVPPTKNVRPLGVRVRLSQLGGDGAGSLGASLAPFSGGWFRARSLLVRRNHAEIAVWEKSTGITIIFRIRRARSLRFARKKGIGLIPIEESYISRDLPEHSDLAKRRYLVSDQTSEPALLGHEPHGWWGEGGMLDWTNKDGRGILAALETRAAHRGGSPLGIGRIWASLKCTPPDSMYWNGKHERDVHNLYNFRWLESIFQGYSSDFPRSAPSSSPVRERRAFNVLVPRCGPAILAPI